MKRIRIIQGLLLMLMLSGCSSENLFFMTYTKAGLDMSITDGVPTQAMFGFKRFEGAIIPVKVEDEECATGKKASANGDKKNGSDEEPEAMSVYAALNLKNSWIKGLKIRQVFATGKAAKNVAMHGMELSRILTAGREEKKDQGGGQ